MLSSLTGTALMREQGIKPLSCLSAILTSKFHTTSVLEIKTAGRYKPTIKRDRPLTYEQAYKPDMIGVRKSWNSFNTSGLVDAVRTAETTHEEILIRKFIHGTWPKLLASDVIIKRRGYTEEILSYVLKSIVKLEIQTIEGPEDLIYKYI